MEATLGKYSFAMFQIMQYSLGLQFAAGMGKRQNNCSEAWLDKFSKIMDLVVIIKTNFLYSSKSQGCTKHYYHKGSAFVEFPAPNLNKYHIILLIDTGTLTPT